MAAYRLLDGGSRLGAGCLRGDQFITTDDLESLPLDKRFLAEVKEFWLEPPFPDPWDKE